MALLNIPPALQALADQTTDKFSSIANFVVDNNPVAIFAVLKANGYTFNTEGEASIIVRSIITGTSDKEKSVLRQLSAIPYLNNNTNGTGGLKGDVGGMSTQGLGDELLCVVGGLFGYPIGCGGGQLTPEQLEQQRLAEIEASKKKRQMTYIIIGIVAVVVIVITVIYFNKKKKVS